MLVMNIIYTKILSALQKTSEDTDLYRKYDGIIWSIKDKLAAFDNLPPDRQKQLKQNIFGSINALVFTLYKYQEYEPSPRQFCRIIDIFSEYHDFFSDPRNQGPLNYGFHKLTNAVEPEELYPFACFVKEFISFELKKYVDYNNSLESTELELQSIELLGEFFAFFNKEYIIDEFSSTRLKGYQTLYDSYFDLCIRLPRSLQRRYSESTISAALGKDIKIYQRELKQEFLLLATGIEVEYGGRNELISLRNLVLSDQRYLAENDPVLLSRIVAKAIQCKSMLLLSAVIDLVPEETLAKDIPSILEWSLVKKDYIVLGRYVPPAWYNQYTKKIEKDRELFDENELEQILSKGIKRRFEERLSVDQLLTKTGIKQVSGFEENDKNSFSKIIWRFNSLNYQEQLKELPVLIGFLRRFLRDINEVADGRELLIRSVFDAIGKVRNDICAMKLEILTALYFPGYTDSYIILSNCHSLSDLEEISYFDEIFTYLLNKNLLFGVEDKKRDKHDALDLAMYYLLRLEKHYVHLSEKSKFLFNKLMELVRIFIDLDDHQKIVLEIRRYQAYLEESKKDIIAYNLAYARQRKIEHKKAKKNNNQLKEAPSSLSLDQQTIEEIEKKIFKNANQPQRESSFEMIAG